MSVLVPKVVEQTQTILANILEENLVHPQTQEDLMKWYETITKQNYVSYKNNILIQKESLAMGTPSSSLIAEMFPQQTEHQHMAQLSTKHKIINYFPYVDPDHSSIQAILADFNILHSKLQFTAEAEKDNAINYLEVNIHRNPYGQKTAIYRKPTSTDTIIPYISNHPPQHKHAAIRFLYYRLHTYNLQPSEYPQEENTIHNILYNNKFPIKPHKPHQPKPQKQ
jgi:hypothetical protein